MPIVNRTAPLSLDILVVGGGIGGLAAAYMLSRTGHRVRVVERYGLDATGGGQRIPPNLSKILRQWVGEDELRKVTSRCIGTPFYKMNTGEALGRFHWDPAVLAETGGDFLLIHREDLIRLLYRLATAAGAIVHWNTEVVSVEQGSPNPSVTLANGEVLTANILIGADGCNSIVRAVVLEHDEPPEPAGLNVYSGMVKAEDIRNDPELSPYLTGVDWPIWAGNLAGIHGELRCGAELYFGYFSRKGSPYYKDGGEERWDEKYSADDLIHDGQCPAVQRLLKSASHLVRTAFMSRPNVAEDWVDSTGRIVLLGNAAHPTIPGGTHPASLAVEDAVVLGCLLSHLRTAEQLPTFLNAYEELRRRRCAKLVDADVSLTMTMSLPPGPEADARDASLRQSLVLERMDESALKAQFEEFAEVFLYDAGDAAEEWWINWGRFIGSAREHSSMMDLTFPSVSVESCA
ncbi:FAD/NAD(P)-binding domain-containing protein [Earliella scabrosa]|nr:FAD/NAD(P)-binding domain-containing protein [Earliella scabrosa]